MKNKKLIYDIMCYKKMSAPSYNEKRIKESLGYLSPMEYRHNLGLVG